MTVSYKHKLAKFPNHHSTCVCGFCSAITNGNGADDKSQPQSLIGNDISNIVQTDGPVDEIVLENLQLQKHFEDMKILNVAAGDTEVMVKNMELQKEINRLRVQLQRIDPHAIRDSVLQEDPDISLLLRNNQKWVQEQVKSDPLFFKKIGAPQTPKYLYIGCSDSRVPANQILGLGPGQVFVHRNVGNQVIGTDLNVLSGIEFAVNVLNVQHIIVTGHYDCGAVKAATKTQDLGLLENWIRSLRDIYRMHHHTLDVIEDPDARHRKFVELSVVEQCLNLYKTGVVQKKRKESHASGVRAFPRIHAMVFDPKVGLLNKLPIDFKTSVGKFRHIYDLY